MMVWLKLGTCLTPAYCLCLELLLRKKGQDPALLHHHQSQHAASFLSLFADANIGHHHYPKSGNNDSLQHMVIPTCANFDKIALSVRQASHWSKGDYMCWLHACVHTDIQTCMHVHVYMYICPCESVFMTSISSLVWLLSFYCQSNWRLMGCPILNLPIMRTMLGEKSMWAKSPMFRLLLSLHSGYAAGVRYTNKKKRKKGQEREREREWNGVESNLPTP